MDDDLDHLHPVLVQDDVEAQQEEGDVLIDAGTHDVEDGDHRANQQQHHLYNKRPPGGTFH